MMRDAGLQPERTSMSWLRTQLVFFILGLLMFRIAEKQPMNGLAFIGLSVMIVAVIITLYNQERFKKLFSNETAVNHKEFLIKKVLSFLLILMSGSYLFFMWCRPI